MDKKRVTAKKVRISDIVNGKYFPGSKEEMKPSFIINRFGEKISRVNLVATVIDKFLAEDENYSTVSVDDGTEAIRVKTFKENVNILKNIELGDLVLVIGKLKEYNGEVYVNGEIVRKVDANYENMRKLEILQKLIEQRKVLDEIKSLFEQMPENELKNYVKKEFEMDGECLKFVVENLRVVKEVDYKPRILELIGSLDTGEGVEMGKIFELSDLPENVVENAINDLLASGVLFEPKPAILRKV